jgi:hypothetical protein
VTVADADRKDEPSLVERWLQEQAHWQRTMLSYLDSMTKDDDFLVHLGNAMRGSLLAGKPYPAPPVPGAAAQEGTPADARLDQILFALHEIQGQIQDLTLSLEELRRQRAATAPTNAPASIHGKPARKRSTPARRASAGSRNRKARP